MANCMLYVFYHNLKIKSKQNWVHSESTAEASMDGADGLQALRRLPGVHAAEVKEKVLLPHWGQAIG